MLVFNAYFCTIFRRGKMQYVMLFIYLFFIKNQMEVEKSEKCAILFELTSSRYRSK